MKTKILLTFLLGAALLLTAICVVRAQDAEARKHWLHDLGGPFFVSRDPVQADLHLSEDQKQSINTKLPAFVQEALALEKLKHDEREPALRALRQKAHPSLDQFLQATFTPDQLKRFRQLKLQYDVPPIMLDPGVGKELGITDAQRQQFMSLVQEMQKAIMPLMQEAKTGKTSPKEILPKVTKLRLDCQAQIEALLSEPQRQQWKEMTGPPLVIW